MTTTPNLSVLIPNYNYARYIGEAIRSVLLGAGADVEVVVCDNASTDDSVAVVRALNDTRIRIVVNPCNVGFAANLERVGMLAQGHRMLLLSSDDRVGPEALRAYSRLEAALGANASGAVWGSATNVIDAAGNIVGGVTPDPKIWRNAPVEAALSQAVGLPVRSLPAHQVLRRSLELLRSPLPFATTCYPRALHDQVGGYAGGRLMNPDKWFLWKLLAVAHKVYVIDAPLFDYRVHDAGQNRQERQSGALKHLTDEYIATFNLPPEVLSAAGWNREAMAAAFIEQDIALRGLVALASSERAGARRMVNFGFAAYPSLMHRNTKVWALRALLVMGPLGTAVAKMLRSQAERAWQKREGT
ncbi:MAG: glycosyltransferase [Kofleriaceae bacterium]|nr:glycosyltransferase [Kofleriaceae bacterium]